MIVSISFLVLGFALPFFPDQEKINPDGTLIFNLIYTVVFVFFSVLTWLTLRKLSYVDIAADDDGIWYMHIGKANGLILWNKIATIKERLYLQCLDLLDCNGERLLRVEYQLTGFDVIRHILNEKTFNINPLYNQSRFSKSSFYHLICWAIVVGGSALGFYLGSSGNPVSGYGAMSIVVILILYEYFVTATGLNICNGYFEIVYPFTKRQVPFSDVS